MEELLIKLNSLAVFRNLLCDTVIVSLADFLKNRDVGSYSEFVSKLYGSSNGDLSAHIKEILFNDENICAKRGLNGISPSIRESLDRELDILSDVASVSPDDIMSFCEESVKLPSFESKSIDLKSEYYSRLENIEKYGYGIYAKYRMFSLNHDGKIVPVRNPDSTRLKSLVGYERQQNIILENTKALLSGKFASNILLTGDAGTGKSSTVKAVINELYTEGLRILELRKSELVRLPEILGELSENPLKFVIFIDDLSFAGSDDSFNAIKAVLEGSVCAKSNNTVIYATSNRRHVVKESFSDREGDDIHRNDTMQETVSLSARFGIHLNFDKPTKEVYLNIVHHLADEYGLNLDTDVLDLEAERFAISRGGRSARAARQLVEQLKSRE